MKKKFLSVIVFVSSAEGFNSRLFMYDLTTGQAQCQTLDESDIFQLEQKDGDIYALSFILLCGRLFCQVAADGEVTGNIFEGTAYSKTYYRMKQIFTSSSERAAVYFFL